MKHENQSLDPLRSNGSSSVPPELCVGIPSVKRDGISYLKTTLGSLQHGLSDRERQMIYFIVLLAHIDQQKHPDYGQAWLGGMADSLPSYAADSEWLALAQKMEAHHIHAVKSKLDYSILMEECQRTGAPYTLLVEDDVVFLHGWRHRTMRALDWAKVKTWDATREYFLYLRLFYYEDLRGWNVESWRQYLGSCATLTVALALIMLCIRHYMPVSRVYLTRDGFLITFVLFLPLVILLYFSAGANCVLPKHTGVHLMADNACCGQGLVFPRATVANELLPLFQGDRWSEIPTDSFIEMHASKSGGLRWALSPVVMQHVGARSSYGEDRGTYGDTTPASIWNFGFENNDPAELAAEHSVFEQT
ncbi:hypothetical protein QQS21_005521 [Conoideocrella luteorostrata]|uniref:Integral membrane protein n=1 Tax=Conoideocrella luteorostrata TaxID=1105319 RepID=A0AAJ0CSE8_9HYPO|nr:hypothetical protein QQS21_005521 [Conoideocrella luteorostrata]